MNERHQYSENTLRILTDAGWYLGRSVSTDAFESFIAEEEFIVNDVIRDFLREFSGLTLKMSRPVIINEKHLIYNNEIPIGTLDKMLFNSIGWAEEHEQLIGDRMAPVAHQDVVTFFISYSGKMYIAAERILTELPGDARDGLEYLCSSRSGLPVTKSLPTYEGTPDLRTPSIFMGTDDIDFLS